MIITNFKTYESASLDEALKLAKIHDEIATDSNVEIQIAVQSLDLLNILKNTKNVKVLAQHVDPITYGAHTGFIVPKHIESMGAYGTLINHSEHKISLKEIQETLDITNKLKLESILCVESLEMAKKCLKFNPNYIALELPDLIGGDISVSKANPELIREASKIIGSDKLLVGAGIKNYEDVKKALELGAKGILLASGITKSKNPKDVLLDLVKAFN